MLLRDLQSVVELAPRRQQEKLENTELLVDRAHYQRCTRPIALCDLCLPVYMQNLEEGKAYGHL